VVAFKFFASVAPRWSATVQDHARGREARCRWCHTDFVVCERCDPAKWRLYCRDCADEAARHARHLRDERYQASEQWREDHRGLMSALRARETKGVIVALCATCAPDAIVDVIAEATPTEGVVDFRGEERVDAERGDCDDGTDTERD
jgi:hypothetical protein